LEQGAPFVLIDAPVLYESGFHAFCEAVICVTAPENLRVERIMRRDGIDREEALLRLDSQMDDATLTARADYVIENDGDRATLYSRVETVMDALIRRRVQP